MPVLLTAWRRLAGDRRGLEADQDPISHLKQQLLLLGSMVEESAVLARAVLAVPDMEAAPQIRRGDDRIDLLYRQLEERCAVLLTERMLSSGEVREVLSYLHCLRDLERFGDYCKELASLGEQLLPAQPVSQRRGIDLGHARGQRGIQRQPAWPPGRIRRTGARGSKHFV